MNNPGTVHKVVTIKVDNTEDYESREYTDMKAQKMAMEIDEMARVVLYGCNRCMYTWSDNGGWCPICGQPATHGPKQD